MRCTGKTVAVAAALLLTAAAPARAADELFPDLPRVGPTGLAIDERGDAWFGENGVSAIGLVRAGRWSENKLDISRAPRANDRVRVVGALPGGGAWWVVENGGRAGTITPDGRTTTLRLPRASAAAAVAPDGALWSIGGGGGSPTVLTRVPRPGTGPSVDRLVTAPAVGLQPEGLTVDVDGVAWIVGNEGVERLRSFRRLDPGAAESVPATPPAPLTVITRTGLDAQGRPWATGTAPVTPNGQGQTQPAIARLPAGDPVVVFPQGTAPNGIDTLGPAPGSGVQGVAQDLGLVMVSSTGETTLRAGFEVVRFDDAALAPDGTTWLGGDFDDGADTLFTVAPDSRSGSRLALGAPPRVRLRLPGPGQLDAQRRRLARTGEPVRMTLRCSAACRVTVRAVATRRGQFGDIEETAARLVLRLPKAGTTSGRLRLRRGVSAATRRRLASRDGFFAPLLEDTSGYLRRSPAARGGLRTSPLACVRTCPSKIPGLP